MHGNTTTEDFSIFFQCTQNDLRQFVLEQWKLADLREMGQGCLLPNLSNILKTTLPGKYAVQVQKFNSLYIFQYINYYQLGLLNLSWSQCQEFKSCPLCHCIRIKKILNF